MYRIIERLEVFLVHPGGPFFVKKDLGAWSIPKGEIQANEDHKDAAIREFKEETGIDAPNDLPYLGETFMKSGKKVVSWAFENNFQGTIVSNNVVHPVYGTFPEVDKGEYFSLETAKEKINPAQFVFIERLMQILINGKL